MRFIKTSKHLLIVESGSKIKLIESFLGKDYQVIASYGHICHIEGLNSINMNNNFETKYSIIKGKKQHIEYMRSIIKQYPKENIYISTDNDNEGEKIAYDICEIFNLPLENTKRIIFSSITHKAVNDAILNHTIVDLDIIRIQKSRQILDMLIGLRITPKLWEHMSKDNLKHNTLSAGRCQSVGLKLIYENHLKSKSNIMVRNYDTVGIFFQHPYTRKFNLNRKFENIDESKHFLELSKVHEHFVNIGEKKNYFKKAPTPFNTASLLSNSNLSPKMTMLLAQELYEYGYITYMRTESEKYSNDFLIKIQKFLLEKYNDQRYIKEFDSIMSIDSKLAHEAIRVTDVTLSSIKGDPKLTKLYKLILNNTIESCMTDSHFNSYDITICAPLSCEYKNVLYTPIFLGYEKFLGSKMDDVSILTFLKSRVNASVNYSTIESNLNIKNSHLYYTETTLINKMINLEIGRPSTYVNFSEINLLRKYVIIDDVEGCTVECNDLKLVNNQIVSTITDKIFGKEKNVIIIQPIGVLCIEFLIKYFDELFQYDYSHNIEKEIDKICSDIDFISFCTKNNNLITSLIDRIDEDNLPPLVSNTPVDKLPDEKTKGLILRKIDEDTSVRGGKYSNYIYHKTKRMIKPRFYNMESLNEDFMTCELKILIDFYKSKKNYVSINI